MHLQQQVQFPSQQSMDSHHNQQQQQQHHHHHQQQQQQQQQQRHHYSQEQQRDEHKGPLQPVVPLLPHYHDAATPDSCIQSVGESPRSSLNQHSPPISAPYSRQSESSSCG